MSEQTGLNDDETLDEKPRKRKKDKGPKRKLRLDDWYLIKRLFGYAKPYRRTIIFALIVGLFASMMMAGNLAVLMPILDVLFEPQTQERLDRVETKLAELRASLEMQTTAWGYIQVRYEVIAAKVDREWKNWLLNTQERALYIMAAALVGMQILKSLLEFLSKYTLQKCLFLAMVRLRTDLYAHCMALDLPQIHALSTGDLISRLNNDMRNVRTVFTTLLSDLILGPFTVIALFCVLLILNPTLTLISIIGLPLVVFPITTFAKRLRTMGRRDEEEDAKILGVSQERLQGLSIVKAYRTEEREVSLYNRLALEMARRQIKREKVRLYSEPFVEVLATIAMAGVLCAGAYIVLKSDTVGMSPQKFLLYVAVLTRFYPPIKRMTNTFIKLQKSLANAERVFQIIDTKPLIQEKPDAVDIESFEKEAVFENVSFGYLPGGRKAIENFSLRIAKGRKIALVGETGAGKSTVIRLLPRFYDPDEGMITIDGVNVADMKVSSLRRLFAVVTQDAILFNDTIAANIAYGKPEATMEEIIAAAQAAYADEFIEHLPNGYETVIGERGGSLSGGQRQRLTIARALLTDSPILVLDEATSALDNVSESLVQQAIENLMENRTVIVIAHRLSTVRKADEIVVMGNGRILERGTHDELMSLSGKYHELIRRPELMAGG